jgi:hypothetical protein
MTCGQPQEWLKHVDDYNTIKVHQQNYSAFVGLEYILCSSLTFSVEPFKCQISAADVELFNLNNQCGTVFSLQTMLPPSSIKG